jgi:hypothetical protein
VKPGRDSLWTCRAARPLAGEGDGGEAMNGKKWYQSKTLWFNILAFFVIVASAFGFADFQPSDEVQIVAGIVITIINLILRLKTNQPVRILPIEE